MLSKILAWRRERYIRKLVSRGLRLGKDVYLNDGFFLDPAHCFLISIGDGVVFGPGVRVFAHDASSKVALGKTKVGLVKLKKGCFVGAGSIILPGSTIGEGSILGAGSVLSGNLPDGEVWMGSPARFLMKVSDYKAKLEALPTRDFAESRYRMGRIGSRGKAEMIAELERTRFAFMAEDHLARQDRRPPVDDAGQAPALSRMNGAAGVAGVAGFTVAGALAGQGAETVARPKGEAASPDAADAERGSSGDQPSTG